MSYGFEDGYCTLKPCFSYLYELGETSKSEKLDLLIVAYRSCHYEMQGFANSLARLPSGVWYGLAPNSFQPDSLRMFDPLLHLAF